MPTGEAPHITSALCSQLGAMTPKWHERQSCNRAFHAAVVPGKKAVGKRIIPVIFTVGSALPGPPRVALRLRGLVRELGGGNAAAAISCRPSEP